MIIFQFHKVQLRDIWKEKEWYSFSFQFHKVQLRDCRNIVTGKANALFQFHKVQLRVRLFSSSCSFIVFQFHKVQLRVLTSQIARHGVTISIP